MNQTKNNSITPKLAIFITTLVFVFGLAAVLRSPAQAQNPGNNKAETTPTPPVAPTATTSPIPNSVTPTPNGDTPVQSATPGEGKALFEDDFESGNSKKWTGQGVWKIVKDEKGNQVFETTGAKGWSYMSPKDPASTKWANYAFEINWRILTPRKNEKDGSEFWLLYRVNFNKNNCVYGFLYDHKSSWAHISRFGFIGNCPYTDITGKNLRVELNQWHTTRIEVVGDKHIVYIDREKLLEGRHDELKTGRIGLDVAPGAVVQFDNVRVIELTDPNPTPTVIPTKTKQKPGAKEPTPTPEKILLEDKFDDGDKQNWDTQGDWSVIKDDKDNFVLQGDGDQTGSNYGVAFSKLSSLSWSDYAIDLDWQIIKQANQYQDFEIDFRSDIKRTGCDFYAYSISSRDRWANFAVSGLDNCQWTSIGGKNVTVSLKQWYHVRIEAVGDRITAYHKGKKFLEVRHDELKDGGFALAVPPGAIIQFDNIKVTDLTITAP